MQSPHLIGELAFLAQDFQILEHLHQSTTGFVCRALRKSDRQAIIIKATLREFPSSADVARLALEFNLLRQVHSPYVVPTLGLARFDARVALLLEDQGAIPLEQALKQVKPDLRSRLRIAQDLALGVAALHAAGVIHRDLHTANIVVSPQNLTPIIIDLSAGCTSGNPVFASGMPVEGTFAFLAPEQTGRLSLPIDERSDLYALGVCLYWLFTAQLPFSVDDPMEMIHQHLAKAPVPPHLVASELPPALSGIVMKLLAKNPDDRYQTAPVLSHDLARCLQAMSSGLTPLDFAPSQERRLHRNLATPSLQGRRQELADLRQAALGGPQQKLRVIALSGEAGIGKSALVQELRQSAAPALFAYGKFDQLSRNLPYRAFRRALGDALRQVLTRDPEQLAFWRAQLLAALGSSVRLLTDILPELVPIFGEQPDLSEVGSEGSRNRFALVIKVFLASLRPEQACLVLHLDDAQWADSATLELLATLLADSSLTGLVVLIAYRDHEVTTTHPLQALLAGARASGVDILSMRLTGLSRHETEQLLAATLGQSRASCFDLANALLSRTEGNPFFIFEILKKLEASRQLYEDPDTGIWHWDRQAVQDLSLTGDVLSLVTERLHLLSDAARQVVEIGACLGSSFAVRDINGLSTLSAPEIGRALHEAVVAQVICPEGGDYRLLTALDDRVGTLDHTIGEFRFRFMHDRILQAAKMLLPAPAAEAYHLRIGRQLEGTARDGKDVGKLFTAVLHLNTAKALLTSETERMDVARLNQQASSAALATVAYGAAADFARLGISLLAADPWQADADLSWRLHLDLLRALYLTRRESEMTALAEELSKHARSHHDQVAVMEVLIHSAVSNREFDAALRLGVAALKLLGVSLPIDAGVPTLLWELIRTKRRLARNTLAELAAKPSMQDQNQRSAEVLLMTLAAPVYFVRPNLFPVLVCRMLQISLRYGHAPASTYAYGVFGVLTCAVLGDVERGYALGRFSIDLLDQLDAKELRGKVMMVFYSSVHHWREPLHEALPQHARAYQAALEVGDFEYAALSSLGYCCYSFLAGISLVLMEETFAKYIRAIQELKESSHLPLLLLFAQMTQNLRGGSLQPQRLDGEIWNAAVQEPGLTQRGDKTTACVKNILSLQLSYLFGLSEDCHSYAAAAKRDLGAIVGTAYLPVYHLYQALSILRNVGANPWARRRACMRARKHLRKLSRWARQSPKNYAHKALLVRAELLRVEGKAGAAGRCYEEAAALAAQHEFTHEEALCHELAAYFHLSLGQRKIAGMYLQEAVETYERWGATAKVAHLRQGFLTLLKPEDDSLLKLSSEPTTAASVASALHGTPTSGDERSFDTATLIKVSRAILSELSQERLFKNLMAIVIENAGAEKGRIVLFESNSWHIAAQADLNADSRTPLATVAEVLPISLLRYVQNAQTSVLALDAMNDPVWNLDPYVASNRVRSVACFPLTTKDQTLGVLYLENNATPGAFTGRQVDLMNVLASQIAISIDNARLYETMEKKVTERTAQLSTVLSELQEAQAELVQSEKMASLASMVAGVAHEINTPLGIGITLASILKHETRAITEDFAVGLKKSQVSAYLDSVKNAVDILEKNLNLVADQVAQFKSASTQDDREKPETLLPAEIFHTAIAGIKLQYDCRLVEFNVQCPPELMLHSYVNALTQITYNLIKNALTHAFAAGKTGVITIAFYRTDQGYSLVFKDNGRGISEDAQKKIFDPFYTTARASGNMGLGLHICYNLVRQKLNGRIECTSQIGSGTTFTITLPPWSPERPRSPSGTRP